LNNDYLIRNRKIALEMHLFSGFLHDTMMVMVTISTVLKCHLAVHSIATRHSMIYLELYGEVLFSFKQRTLSASSCSTSKLLLQQSACLCLGPSGLFSSINVRCSSAHILLFGQEL